MVKDQAEVIERFSDSVTNSDVLDRVQGLENRLEQESSTMRDRLEATERRVENLLNSTLDKLDEIVNTAQDEIHQEVDRVKEDVDSYVRTTQDQFSMENSFMVYQLAGTFTLLACLISMWHMTAHLRKFRQPYVQRKVLAILWMSPIYGITSWLSLVFPKSEGYLAVVKDFYEAYVIYQFLSFLIAVLGHGDRESVVDVLVKNSDHLEPPFRPLGRCFPAEYDTPRAMADAVLLQCQTFTMQFVFCRPLTTIGTFACNEVGYFGRGESATDYRSPQFWFIMIQNVSIFFAFSGLLKFYHAVQEELAWCRPFPKFLCIKGIVFMTFWQGLAIAILAKTTESQPAPGEDDEPDIWAKQAQNFLICLEMLLFSIAHFYCFPTEEWQDGYRPRTNADSKFGDNIALRDFFSDLKLVLRQGSRTRSLKKKKRKDDDGKGGTRTPPEEEEEDEDESSGNGGASAVASGSAREGGDTDDRSVEPDPSTTTSEDGNAAAADVEAVTPEMRRAAARLLASLNFKDFESGDFLDDGDDEEEGDDDDDEEEGAAAGNDGYGATDVDYDGSRRPREADDAEAAAEAEDEDGRSDPEKAMPDETTGLLASGGDGADDGKATTTGRGRASPSPSGGKNHHLLRPSIFTKMASKAESD